MQFVGEAAGGLLLRLQHVPGDAVEHVGLPLDAAHAAKHVCDGSGGAECGEDEAGAEQQGGLAREFLELGTHLAIHLREMAAAEGDEMVDALHDLFVAGEKHLHFCIRHRAAAGKGGAGLAGESLRLLGQGAPFLCVRRACGLPRELCHRLVGLGEFAKQYFALRGAGVRVEPVQGKGERILLGLDLVQQACDEALVLHEARGARADLPAVAHRHEAG